MMDSVCGRESSLSPPSVVAPVAVKPPPLSDSHAVASPTDQQRLLYQLALAERLRLASAGLAWARPPLAAAHHHPLQDQGLGGHLVGGLMGTHLMGGFGSPLMGGLGTAAGLGSALMAGQGGPPPPAAAYPPPHPLYGYRLVDPRALLARGPEEPKPQHSYIGLIAMAILSSPDKKLVLSDIYQYILDHYPYFRSRGPGWRNSIRHNLSLNDCFVKAGRSANGKGHYWAIHPANIDDFRRGDFRRRRAQRRVRKHLGLAVDDDSSPEPPSPTPSHTPTPVTDTPTAAHIHHHHLQHQHTALTVPEEGPPSPSPAGSQPQQPVVARKRQFDVASLLAPDDKLPKSRRHASDLGHDDHGEIDVVSDDPGDDTRPSVAPPSPTTGATNDDEDDDPRPWSLLGWVSGAPWPLPPPPPTSQPPTSDEGDPRTPSAHEPCPAPHDPNTQ
ncbi:forkhead box protein L2-like [Macrobrachium rosenbergii]|uniref:forkhead box protein L2-like n=1 Tax=Macrobrachium rosenbergii TaxID=79674 RepID=UPI0034D4817A